MTPDTSRAELAIDSRHQRRPRLAVLISGRGSNLQAILDAIAARRLNADVAVVVSNRADAIGLSRARQAGIDAVYLDPKSSVERDEYDQAIVDRLRPLSIDLICLAGYMRIVGPVLRDAYPNRIVNIHPSLLPSFPGLHPQRQALEHGVRVAGATVHLVNGSLDAGPIVLQAAVPVLDDDDEERLSARILVEEHRIYPEAIRILLEEPWSVSGRRVVRRPRAGA